VSHPDWVDDNQQQQEGTALPTVFSVVRKDVRAFLKFQSPAESNRKGMTGNLFFIEGEGNM